MPPTLDSLRRGFDAVVQGRSEGATAMPISRSTAWPRRDPDCGSRLLGNACVDGMPTPRHPLSVVDAPKRIRVMPSLSRPTNATSGLRREQ
jgi:hypothetical protein